MIRTWGFIAIAAFYSNLSRADHQSVCLAVLGDPVTCGGLEAASSAEGRARGIAVLETLLLAANNRYYTSRGFSTSLEAEIGALTTSGDFTAAYIKMLELDRQRDFAATVWAEVLGLEAQIRERQLQEAALIQAIAFAASQD